MLFVLIFFIFSMMVNINIGTINIHGAQFATKIASLFHLLELKKLDVVLIQETQSDEDNEGAWRKEWSRQLFLSHKLSNSAGVGILFSTAFNPQSVETIDILAGHALMVKTVFEEKTKTVFPVCLCPHLGL